MPNRDPERLRDALTRNENALRMLYEAVAAHDRPFDESLRDLFAVGHEVLGLRIGILAHVEGDRYEISEVSAPPEFELSSGTVFALGQTFCLPRATAAGWNVRSLNSFLPMGTAAGSRWIVATMGSKYKVLHPLARMIGCASCKRLAA